MVKSERLIEKISTYKDMTFHRYYIEVLEDDEVVDIMILESKNEVSKAIRKEKLRRIYENKISEE